MPVAKSWPPCYLRRVSETASHPADHPNLPSGRGRPRIAINIANCVAGGGLQIGTWFVQRVLDRREELPFDTSLIINRLHMDRLAIRARGLSATDLLVVDKSPMRSFRSRWQIGRFLRNTRHDSLVSLFGPSGVSFPHQISGIANAFITSNDVEVLKRVFPRSWPLQRHRFRLYGRMIAASQRLIFETAVEQQRFASAWSYPLDRTYVIGNSVNDAFLAAGEARPQAAPDRLEAPRILFVTGGQPHKNNHMIPAYIAALKRAGLKQFTLALTLDPASLGAGSEIAQHLDLLGSLSPEQLVREYGRATFVVQASSLETYSAVYNEVRFTGRALLASDRDFAREICGDFAHFFEPLDADSFAAGTVRLLAHLAEAEDAAWQARSSVILPDEKFSRLLNVIVESLRADLCDSEIAS